MSKLIDEITSKYSDFSFVGGDVFSWDPINSTITFPKNEMADETTFIHGLLHEISHGILGHYGFKHDIELLKMERDAWFKATSLLFRQGVPIDTDHIDSCLDSYRDWLYARAQCPQCGLVGAQTKPHTYSCIHCHINWQVPTSRLCTVRRKILANSSEYFRSN